MQPRKLVLEFTKMSGAGNDFIVLDNRFYHFSRQELSDLAIRFCARRTSVGADGLLALHADDNADFRMVYINADGSNGSMCGNGARCLARYARDAGIQGDPMTFETDAGRYQAHVDGSVVRLGIPAHRDYREVAADEAGPDRCYLWTGTEHLVVFVQDVEAIDVAHEGPRLRHTNAPAGANVNFVQVTAQGLRVRTFEKGVEGETLACGTGATAAAVAASRAGHIELDRVSVLMRGGELAVGLDGDGTAIYLEGPADYVFRGTLEV